MTDINYTQISIDINEKIEQINHLKNQLQYSNEFGDWKNLKQLDTGEYTEEEMLAYRAGRAKIREEINKLQQEIDDLLNY